MDLKIQTSIFSLFRNLLDSRITTIPHIRTNPQKPSCHAEPISQPLPRSTPEAAGISSDHIAEFLKALRNDDTLDYHKIMILRNGSVITECSFGAYDQNIWHITHSMCKSITGLAIGILIDEGKLNVDDRIVDILKNHTPKLALLTHKGITVRHLLTMSSGVLFNEAGAITETDWVRCFMESMVLTEPGKHFNYNSMNTYILSAIIKEVSSQGLTEYLKDRLLKPMGIKEIFWEKCPKGIEKGGWGLYIRSEDIAKIGQLVLQKGRWGDRQLISKKWIEDATSFQIKTPLIFGGYNYGYQIWVGREESAYARHAFLFNGIFGQNVIGWHDTGLLIVSFAGNNELFQKSNFFALLEQYFPADYRPDETIPENPAAYYRLKKLLISLNKNYKSDESIQINELNEMFSSLDGKNYSVDDAAAPAVGLLPLLTQVIQNNYTRGLRSLGFEYSGDKLDLILTEADEIYRLPIGFDSPIYTDLDFHGEPYKVAVTGKAALNEHRSLVLNIRVSFIEIANTRFLEITFKGDSIITKWSETPGELYFNNAIAEIKSEFKLYPFLEKVIALTSGDFFRAKISSALKPEVIARQARQGDDSSELF